MEIKQTFKERFTTKLGMLLLKASTRVMIAGVNLTKHNVKFSKVYKKEPVEITGLNSELLELVGMDEFNKLPLTERFIKKTVTKDVEYACINANKPAERKFIAALESGLYHAFSELSKAYPKLSKAYPKITEFEISKGNIIHLTESPQDPPVKMPKVDSYIFSKNRVEEILEKFLSEDNVSVKQKMEFEFEDKVLVKIESAFNEKTNSKTTNLKIFKDDSEVFSELISTENLEKIVEKIKKSNYGIL